MNSSPVVRPRRSLFVHVAIQIGLLLLYFLPGGLLWNRVEPLVFHLPFGVFATTLLLPALIVANMALYVIGHWADDKQVGNARDPSDVSKRD
ncbi:MAG: hypothetical protein WD066_01315 [Planctomycetaceae bacterium]